MRAFAIQMSDMAKCPIRSWSPRHWRSDRTCLCDGKPAFEMNPVALRAFSHGKWVDLNHWLMVQEGKGGVASHTLYHRLWNDGWPADLEGTHKLAESFSLDHPKVLLGVFSVTDEYPRCLYFQGAKVITGPWVPVPK